MSFFSNIKHAKETLAIIEKKRYMFGDKIVDIKNEFDLMMEGTHTYFPADYLKLEDKILEKRDAASLLNITTNITVTKETTTQAMRRLASKNPVCLNFASGTTPGGGFLTGSNAQEESLARASTLYASIKSQKAFYSLNKRAKSPFYSDAIIYSPGAVFFREENGDFLPVPYLGSVISSPAANIRLSLKSPDLMQSAREMMTFRIEKILDVALLNGHKTLVLGAFGCGVFGNNPVDVSSYFNKVMGGGGKYENIFDEIVFAIPDIGKNERWNHATFQLAFKKR